MSWAPYQSLRWKLAGLVACLIALLTLVLLVTLPSVLLQQAERWMRSRAVGVATAFATSLEAPLNFDDAGSARTQVRLMSEIPGAIYARLLRDDGSTLAEWGADRIDGQLRTPVTEPIADLDFASGCIRVGVPIWSRGSAGVRSGSLLVGFDLTELQQQQQSARWALMVTSGAILILGLLGALVVGTIFARPISRVTEVAARVAAGDLEARGELDTGRRDETGHMAAAISTMVEQLSLQQAVLERRVVERTRDLATANEQLTARLAELRTTQQQLIVADRRLAVGKLVLGVAHEINNPLSYVIANVDHVREIVDEVGRGQATHQGLTAPQLTDVSEALQDAREGAERVRRIVKKLQATSQGGDDDRSPLDLHATLDAAIRMALNEIRHRARLTTDLGPTPVLMASELQLGQVFLNLLVNAAHAIERSRPEEDEVRITSRTDERGWAIVEVADTGTGIAPEDRDRIFDPFFTTKDVGQGSGLGLSICQGIVTAHGGTITVETEVGRGSTFTVALPPAQPHSASVAPQVAARIPGLDPTGHRLRLLLVDDDEHVASALRRSLWKFHDAEVALGGHDALARLRGGGSAFDVVVCDLMMPDLTGMELHASLEREQPTLARRMVFMSGGAFTEAARRFAAQHEGRTIEKPVDLCLLLDRIHSVLADA